MKLGVNLLFIRPGVAGGSATYARHLLDAISEKESVEIFIYAHDFSFRLKNEGNVRYRHIPAPFRSLHINAIARSVAEQVLIPPLAIRDKIDILFSPAYVTPLLFPGPKVAAIHDIYYASHPQFLRPSLRVYWRLMIPLTIKSCDALITASDISVNEIVKRFPTSAEKLHRIYHGSPQTSVAENIKRENFALFVGPIYPNKNVETVIDAWSILKKKGSDIRLVIAGDDPSGILASALRDRAPVPELIYENHVNDERLAYLYKSALCVVVPSLYEGFGMVALEAMAHGCPVVTSGGGALKEIVGKAGLYFDPTSSSALADVVYHLINNPDLRDQLSRAGHKASCSFTWEKTADKTLNLFNSLI